MSKSVEYTLINGYNWLLKVNLIPDSMKTMSQGQIKTFMSALNRLYVTESSDLSALIFLFKVIVLKILLDPKL